MKKNNKAIVNFLFEVGILSKTPRSGFHFLGSGKQSVAEHTNRTVYAGYVLALLEGDVDMGKVLQMCLLHDLAEARTSDLNYVHQKYVSADEKHAMNDLASTLPFGKDLLGILQEYSKRESKESIIAKDADNLDWILSLKEEVDIGNTRAKSWLPSAVKRLKTKTAISLANQILETNSDDWWFAKKDDEWWVKRDKKSLKKRF
ncbi:MAG TPA: HD domain-containing protein [Patescibacteria group bacterium]|nr:HD domain-containing protein [Patescibacteria group bacterium]